uniref:Uncharacterized protein n=1 Tax=Hordeum vulgare subsp. vulgare TaxID=112509 RepID=A0A023IN84_HORVV|nr:hypothetical protein [Hordeum vulgare subsp. vulgare]
MGRPVGVALIGRPVSARSLKMTHTNVLNDSQTLGLTGTPHIQPKYVADMGSTRACARDMPDPPTTPRPSHNKLHPAHRSKTLDHSLSSLALSSPLPAPNPIESGGMSISDSRSGDDLDPEYELALCIALERSKVETGETDAWRLRWMNPKMMWIPIEQSEREAVEIAAEAAPLDKLEREQVWWLKGLVILSDDDDDDHSSSSDSPPAADSYNYVDDRKGKGLVRKW